MGVILRVADGENLIFSIYAVQLTICKLKISGWEVLLFLKIDNFKVKAFKNWL